MPPLSRGIVHQELGERMFGEALVDVQAGLGFLHL